MHIAHFGTFDVSNYGDLLFPTVAQHYFDSSDTTFTWVSPRGGPPVADDCVETKGVTDLKWSEFDFDVALIGGGNIVSALRTSLPAYREIPGLDAIAYPSLWLSACLRAAEIGASIAWNAPGIMQPVWRGAAQKALELCFAHSHYIALRETGHLEASDIPRREINVVPDTAVVLPRIWSRETVLAPIFNEVSRGLGVARPYFIVHLKARNAPTKAERRAAAAAIDGFAMQTGLIPVLLPIGRCHGDDDFLRLLALDMRASPVIADSVSGLKATTSVIANAQYVVTGSLHCAIVGAAYGVPVSLLATKGNPKYQAFFEGHLRFPGVVHNSIGSCLSPATMNDLAGRASDMAAAIAEANTSVDAHFLSMKQAISRRGSRIAHSSFLATRMSDMLAQQAGLAPYLPIDALL